MERHFPVPSSQIQSLLASMSIHNDKQRGYEINTSHRITLKPIEAQGNVGMLDGLDRQTRTRLELGQLGVASGPQSETECQGIEG